MEEQIAFKIVSGFYKDITYVQGETVRIKNILLEEINIVSSLIYITEASKNFKRMISSNIEFDAIFTGLSRIDKCPMFKIDVNIIRDSKINKILDE